MKKKISGSFWILQGLGWKLSGEVAMMTGHLRYLEEQLFLKTKYLISSIRLKYFKMKILNK